MTLFQVLTLIFTSMTFVAVLTGTMVAIVALKK